jgi:hypothetical protein
VHLLFRCQGVPLSRAKLSHITTSRFSRASEVLNSVVFLNNLAEASLPSSSVIEFAMTILESALPDMDEEMQKKMSFLLEQMDLCLKGPKQRRYSAFLLATAMMWRMTSPALYKQLLGEGIFSLPCVRHLKRLSSALTVDGTLSDSTRNYLKLRLANLGPRDKLTCIIIDEVYCQKQVEFAGGKLFGMENDDISKTLLCFMLKSVGGNYRDMVVMQPIAKVDASVIETHFLAVLEAVTEIGFEVVCVSTDGHSANRKFYEQLSRGKIKPFILHPSAPEKKIFLLFDPVHLFKNFYTNFLNKTHFSAPPFKGTAISGNFNHVVQLYYKELGKPIKAAHKLIQKVLTPRPIERCNVMLAERLFHESTIAALMFYGDPEWKNTAQFLELIHRWWNIVNVRSTSIGIRKRNEFQKPVTSVDSDKIDFLQDFCNFLLLWKDFGDKNTRLTRETMYCAIQTNTALPLLARYLLQDKEFNFVLLGKISSDAIEQRFGHYRQLAGSNYFLSVRQFLEAEKAIRLKSLVKYSHLSMVEVTQSLSDMDGTGSDPSVQADVDSLLTLLEEEALEIEMSEDREDAIVFFVSGYVAKGLLRKTNCQLCVQLICESKEMPPVLFCEDEGLDGAAVAEKKSAFLDQVNRGGLVKPSDLVFIYCLHAHELHRLLFATEQTKKVFTSARLPRAVFVTLLRQKLEANCNTSQLLEIKCSAGHDFSKVFSQIATTFCNCMMKNFVSEVNDKLHEARKRAPKSQEMTPANRKIAKLNNE